MGIDSRIKDGKGNKRYLSIDRNNSAKTSVTGLPPESSTTILKPYVEFLTDSAGASSMLVDGSVSEKMFFIESSPDYDRHVLSMSFTIEQDNAKLNLFGALAKLTNGCQLYYQDNSLGDVFLHEAIKSNYDLVQMCLFNPAFGTGTEAFKGSNVDQKLDAYIPVLDIKDAFGLAYGVLIPAGSDKKIVFNIRDDITGLGRFDCKVLGYDVVHA